MYIIYMIFFYWRFDASLTYWQCRGVQVLTNSGQSLCQAIFRIRWNRVIHGNTMVYGWLLSLHITYKHQSISPLFLVLSHCQKRGWFGNYVYLMVPPIFDNRIPWDFLSPRYRQPKSMFAPELFDLPKLASVESYLDPRRNWLTYNL